MKQGNTIKFPCGAVAKIELLQPVRCSPPHGLVVIKFRNLACTKFDEANNVLNIRFQERAISTLIASLQSIQRELNK